MGGSFSHSFLFAASDERRVRGRLSSTDSVSLSEKRPEAAMALRMRMNETYEELVHLKREHTAMQIKLKAQTEEVVLLRSDCTVLLRPPAV